MDGAILLDSLVDWTVESHPYASAESRQNNNNLMGELRTELFTLLGSTTQVGGDSSNTGDISIVQPMDEELVRQLSPAELTYRLSLAESGWHGMVGGGVSPGNELVLYSADVNQSGGAADSDIGWLQKTKIMLGLRKFNEFIDEFESLRAQINKNMAGYEVEVDRGKIVTDNIVKAIRDMFLNKKFETMNRIMLGNDPELQKNPVKSNIVQRRIDSATQEIKRLNVVLDENVEEANKIFLIKSWFSGYKESRGVAFWQKNSFISKLISEVNAQQKAYLALNKEFNYYAKEVERAKNLKALEAAVANKNVSELTKFQRKEIAEYQKNREKYEKMFAFSDTRRNEYEELMNKKEKIVDKLDFYKKTLTIGNSYTTKKQGEMQKALKSWDDGITDIYKQLTEAIDTSGTYKKHLDTLRQKITNNGNIMDGLVAGMAEMEDYKKIYVKFLDNAEKAYEIQDGIGNALKEIKRKFIELIPDASLLPDMHRVVSAQSFVVSLARILTNTLTDLGVNEQKARERLKDFIKRMKGGAPTNDLALSYHNNDGGVGGDISNTETNNMMGGNTGPQTGGVNFKGTFDQAPVHGNAFFDHADDGRVWSQAVAGPNPIAEGYTPLNTTAPIQPTLVKILTLPYGVRRISQEYMNNVNGAINQIADDKIIYIPVINYKNLKSALVGGYEYELFTAVYDSSAIRILGHQTKTLSNQRDYNRIHSNYYVYNILEFNNERTKDRYFVDLFRTTCDRLNDMKFMGNDFIILPVFYKLGTGLHTVTNPIFEYDEYVLLHPLLGCVMTATIREADLARMRYINAMNANDPSNGYEFSVTGRQPPTLNLTLKLQQKQLTNISELKDTSAAANTFDYYYNFSGPNILFKTWLGLGQPFFETLNFSNIPFPPPLGRPNPGAGSLQPRRNNINMKNQENEASYAHYMFQLTGHLNELVNKLGGIRVILNPAPTINPLFSTNTQYTIYGKYEFEYDKANYTAVKAPIQDVEKTQLDTLDISGKTWNDAYADNFFGEHDPAKLAVIFLPMKVLIADLLYWIREHEIAIVAAKTKTGTALALYNSAYTAAATAAGVPASAIPTPGGTGTGTGSKLSPLDPRYNQRLDFINKRLTSGSAYFENLVEMDGICKKFAAPEFQEYSEKLYKAYETMSVIRIYETKILDIKPEKDEFTLPEFSLVTKNLEPKVEPGSKDAYTNAGQKLYEKLKENKTYIAQNEYAVNSDNLVRDLDDVLYQVTKSGFNAAKDWSNITFFTIPPGDKYVDILSTQAGATKFISQLQADKKWQHHETMGKISHAMQLILRLDPLGQAYNIFEKNGYAETNKQHLFKAKKKGNKGNGKSKKGK